MLLHPCEGGVNTQKSLYFADDRILVKVIYGRSHRQFRSVSLGHEKGALAVNRGSSKRFIFNLLERDVHGAQDTVAHVDLQLISAWSHCRSVEVENVLAIRVTEHVA